MGRAPTLAETAGRAGLDAAEVASVRSAARTMVSLEAPVSHDDDVAVGEFIADEQAESPYECTVRALTAQAVRDALATLRPRERRVLELRYGLGGEDPHTLAELSRIFHVTRERIRRIEHTGLRTLSEHHELQ